MYQNEWKRAEMLLLRVSDARRQKLGEDHPDRLSSMSNLASAYWHQGSWQEAESLFVRVIKGRKLRLGDNHPVTILR